MTTPVRIVIQGIDKFSATIGKSMRGLDKLGKKTTAIGKTMSLGLTVPILAAGVGMVKASIDMNKGMANVGTLIPGNIARLKEMKLGVQDLAVETGSASGDITAGLFQVISAFGDTGETMEKLRINTRGAVAGISSVEDAINLTSLVTKNYGDTSAKATQAVLDLAFKANELGKTSFPEMAESLGKAVPFAKTLGVKMTELFGVMGTFTGVTGNTSEVTTQLTGFLGAMLKPTRDMEIAFGKLGVKSGEELIRTRGLQGAMQALVDVSKPYPGVLGKILGRKEALNLVLAGTGELAEAFAEKTLKMTTASGAMEKAFKEQSEGINKFGFQLGIAKQKFIVFAQAMGDSLSPMLGKVLKKLTPFLDMLMNLSPQVKIVIITIAGLVAVLGPMLLMIGIAISGFASIGGAVAGAGGAIALILNPIGLVIAAVVGIVTVLKLAGLKWREIFSLFIPALMPVIAVVEFLMDNWKRILPFFKLLFLGIGFVLKKFVGVIKPILTPFLFIINAIIDSIKFVLNLGLGILEKIAGKFLSKELKAQIGFDPPKDPQNSADKFLQGITNISQAPPPGLGSQMLLRIQGAPKGSILEVEKGNPDIEMESGGLLPAAG